MSTRISRTIEAPLATVWEVLDDFPAVSEWDCGIEHSFSTGDADRPTGLGAERRCDLGEGKFLDQRIVAYEQFQGMTIDVWNLQGIPLKSARASFALRSLDPQTTEVSLDVAVEPKAPRLLVRVLANTGSRFMATAFTDLLNDLAVESTRRASK